MEESKIRFRVTKPAETQKVLIISGTALILFASAFVFLNVSPFAMVPFRLAGAAAILSAFDSISVYDREIISTRFSLIKKRIPVSEIREIRTEERKGIHSESGVVYHVCREDGSRCFSFRAEWENGRKLLNKLYEEGIRVIR